MTRDFAMIDRVLDQHMEASKPAALNPLLFEGHPGDPPSSADAVWGRFAINYGESQQTELGRVNSRFRVVGEAVLQVFGPIDRGKKAILAAVDEVASAFRGKSLGHGMVSIQQPSVQRVGRDGSKLQYNVAIPFQADPRNGALTYGTQPPSSATSGVVLDTSTVELHGPDESVDATRNDEVTLHVIGNATLSGTTTKNAVNGVATFDDVVLAVSDPETVRLEARAAHWWSRQSAPIDVALP